MIGIRLAAAALAVSPLFAASAPALGQPAQMTIDVRSYAFAPSPIHLAAGRPVTLTFVNRSGGKHDFTAPTFFAASAIAAGAAPDGGIDLAPHSSVSITLTPRAGRYRAHCGRFMHAMFGMKDTILVD